MRLYKRSEKHGSRINIASLIDIFFLLIIFFMSVSKMVPSEMPVELPAAKNTEAMGEANLKRIVFNVEQDGQVFLCDKQIDIASASVLLSQEAADRGAENVEVLLRGDRASRLESVASIMRACSNAGISRVRIGVVESEVDIEF